MGQITEDRPHRREATDRGKHACGWDNFVNMSHPSNTERASRQRKTKAHKGSSRTKRPIRVPDRSPEEQTLAAHLLERIKDVPDVREELCERVKQQIAEGAYETAERMEEAVERLVDELLEDDGAQPNTTGEPGVTD